MADYLWLDQVVDVLSRGPRYLKLAGGLAADSGTPSAAKAMLVGAVAYSVSPVDLVPGLVPVLGQIDDVLVPLLILRKALTICPATVRVRHLKATGLTLANIDNDICALSRPYRAAGEGVWSALKHVGGAVRDAVTAPAGRGGDTPQGG